MDTTGPVDQRARLSACQDGVGVQNCVARQSEEKRGDRVSRASRPTVKTTRTWVLNASTMVVDLTACNDQYKCLNTG